MEKITVQVDHNESSRKGRAGALKIAVESDSRFAWGGAAELPLDVQFKLIKSEINTEKEMLLTATGPTESDIIVANFEEKIWNVELKEGADFISSIMTGHLYEQMLSAREIGTPTALCVLNSDTDIETKLLGYLKHNNPVPAYLNCWRDFEAQCFALNVSVFYFSRRWPERLLSHAAKLFCGGDMLAHRPKIMEGERQIYSLSILADRLGPVAAKNILRKYGTYCKAVAAFADPFCNANFDDIPEVGPVRMERLYKSGNKKLEFKS